MNQLTRKNAWTANNGGQLTDAAGKPTELFWYAKAVQVMQARPISDPTSWWIFAAMHGELLLHPETDPSYQYLNWDKITYILPEARLAEPPALRVTDLMWGRCQHGTWYFAPWHRGYLFAMEKALRDIIQHQLNGPATWALPYWNYLDPSTTAIPPAFRTKQLPDGSRNPLYVAERYGLDGDGAISIPLAVNQPFTADDMCQWDKIYYAKPGAPGPGNRSGNYYGGDQRQHKGSGGDLEKNPHNNVHTIIGGTDQRTQQGGLMAFPETAALDPIFYVHHANIDRMWASWNETGQNRNTEEAYWLQGPATQGDKPFVMPLDANGALWFFTPADVKDTHQLAVDGAQIDYTYDDLSLVSFITNPPEAPARMLEARLEKLGATIDAPSSSKTRSMKQELVGASTSPVVVQNGATQTEVKIDRPSWQPLSDSLEKASFSQLPDEVFLQLDGVKGVHDANFLNVSINGQFIESISLFGLRMASRSVDSPHGNAGLTFKMNITNIVDELHLNNEIDTDSLQVLIEPARPLPDGGTITVDRISVYRASR